MDSSLVQLRKREKKEQNIKILLDIVGTCDSQIVLKKRMYNQAVDRYNKWCETQKIDPITKFAQL